MARLQLRFLGSGDAFGSGGRFQTCMLVESDATRFLIDCEASSLVAMRKFGVDPQAIDTVVLSHLHGDHFAGVPFLVLDGQFRRRTRPLLVAGPPGVEARVTEAMEALFPGSSRVARRFPTEFVELREREPTALPGFTVTPFVVLHPSGAPPLALRVACEGRVIAYSGDTEWTDGLVGAADGADLFVCEALFPDRTVRYHLSWRAIAEQRSRLRCGRLILTHMGEEMLARVADLDVEWAEDGKTVVL